MSLWTRQYTCKRAFRQLSSLSSYSVRSISSTSHNSRADVVNEPATRREPYPVQPKWTNAGDSKQRTRPSHDLYRDPAAEATDHVSITVDGQQHSFSPLLLRDLCSCSRCIDTSTRQKTFATADISSNVRASRVEMGPSSARLHWENDLPGVGDDHVTELSIMSLRNLIQHGSMSHRRSIPSRALWTAQEFERDVEDFDFEAYMQDDSVLLKAIRQLHTHGLLFVTNIPGDERAVEAIGERMGPLKMTFYGRTWDVKSVPQAKNVAYTSEYLGFHMDIMYLEQPPHVQLLHCIRSSAKGGASLFTDSFKAANAIGETDPTSWQALSQFPIDYHYDHPGEHYYHQARPVVSQKSLQIGHQLVGSWEQYVEQKDNMGWSGLSPIDFIDNVTWSPPFQAPFSYLGKSSINPADISDSSNITAINNKMAKWHAAAKKFSDMIHEPKNIHERLMKSGECVVFDNRRVLHARTGFEVGDAGVERFLRGTYVDRDPLMSRMKILTDQE